jgi:hypothetical protein
MPSYLHVFGPHVTGMPTDSSAGLLLVGRTHLSGMAVSLVGGDPGVPMSHTWELDPGVVRPTRRCAAIPGVVPLLYGMAGVIPHTVLPTPILSPHRTPRRRTVTPSKGVRPPTRCQPGTTPRSEDDATHLLRHL